MLARSSAGAMCQGPQFSYLQASCGCLDLPDQQLCSEKENFKMKEAEAAHFLEARLHTCQSLTYATFGWSK